MSESGRLARGKANYDAKAHLDNSETIAYAATLIKSVKPKEVKNAKQSK